MTTKDVLILCTACSIAFIFIAICCLIVIPIKDRYRYRKYLAFMREDIRHKMDDDDRDDVRDWYNNELMLKRYNKLPAKHRVISPYLIFLILFTISVLFAFVPFCIYDNSNADAFINVFKTIFTTIRSFFWGSSFDKLSEIDTAFPIFYLRYLSFIFVMAGLVVATSLFKLFKEFFSYLKYWIMHPFSDVYVFSKLNDKSIALAEDIFKNKDNKIKIIKKKKYRDKDIEQELFYIETKYKYELTHIGKDSLKKADVKKDRKDKLKSAFQKLNKQKESIEKAYESARYAYKSARSAHRDYDPHKNGNSEDERNRLRDEQNQLRDDMRQAKNKYRSFRVYINYLLTNVVEAGKDHVRASLIYVLANTVSFLLCGIGTLLFDIVLIIVFIALFPIHILLLLFTSILHLTLRLFALKSVASQMSGRYQDFQKSCQAKIVRIALATFDFLCSRSKWLDKLFHKRLIYFCDVYPKSDDYHDELMDRARYLGATVMKRDITELRLKWWCRSRTMYLMSDNDDENTEHAIFLQNACTRSATQRKILNNGRTEIYVFASDNESEYVIDDLNIKLIGDRIKEIDAKKIDRRSFDIMRLRRINMYSDFATNFFWDRYDTFLNKARDAENGLKIMNIAIVGCGRYGREFVKTLCCLGQLPHHKLSIEIFDRDIDKVKSCMPNELIKNSGSKDKSLPEYEIKFTEKNVNINDAEFLNQTELSHTHIFVMLGDDELNIQAAMSIRRKYKRESSFEPLIYAIVNDYQRHFNLKQGDELFQYEIRPVGRTITRYSERNIRKKDIERCARTVHTSFMFNDLLSNHFKSLDDACKSIGVVLPFAVKHVYPFVTHEIYRSLQDCIAEQIEYINFDNLYDIWKLVCRVRDNIRTRKALMDDKDNKPFSYVRFRNDFKYYYLKQISDKTSEISYEQIIKDMEQMMTVVEQIIDFWLDSIVKDFIKFDRLFDFDSKEYFRRSSKSRALYEHILFKKNMIKYAERIVKVNTFDNNNAYTKVWFADNSSGIWLRHKWQDAKWIMLNDLMQKRWMVFMWGEGYTYKEKYDDETKRTDVVEKTHKYLKSYWELCRNEQDSARQTMEILHIID